jgi:hypothetical protein
MTIRSFYIEGSAIKGIDIVYTFNEKEYLLPVELKKIRELLISAELILELKDNWDDMNGRIISKKTFEGMASFLVNYSSIIYLKYKKIIDFPTISPSLEGSIDLDWETDSYGMLINISDGGDYAAFYGDNKKKKQMIEGSFIPSGFDISLLPLAIEDNE